MIYVPYEEGNCAECNDTIQVPSVLKNETTCKQCQLIQAVLKIADVLDRHIGWD